MSGSFSDPSDVLEKINNTTLEEVIEASKKVKLDTVYFLEGDDTEVAE